MKRGGGRYHTYLPRGGTIGVWDGTFGNDVGPRGGKRVHNCIIELPRGVLGGWGLGRIVIPALKKVGKFSE